MLLSDLSGRTDGKKAHQLLLANNEFVNATTTTKNEGEGGGVIQTNKALSIQYGLCWF